MIAGGGRRLTARDEGLDPPHENGPFQEHPVLALLTLDADVGPEADDPPLVAAARMDLS